MAKNKSIIAKNIKKFRQKRGISQDRLSKIADITYGTVIKIESGVTYDPRVGTLKRLADALNIKIDDLIR